MCNTEIATRDPSQGFFLSPVVAVDSALTIYQAKKDFIDKILRPGCDYGTIPGGNNKPCLLKPGAEKMASFFGLSPIFQDIKTEEDWTGADHGGEPFFYYRIKCQLRRGEMIIGEADGSCNSWEKKYRYRSAGRVCPTCGKPTLLRSKGDKPADAARKRQNPQWEPGWFCWAKKGGCGGQFEYNDTRIPQQEAGNMPNPDVAEQVNTILKMAQKRALIAATLIATGVSEYFTQDVDDFTPGEHSYEPQATDERGTVVDATVQDDPKPQATRPPQTQQTQPARQTSVPDAAPTNGNTPAVDVIELSREIEAAADGKTLFGLRNKARGNSQMTERINARLPQVVAAGVSSSKSSDPAMVLKILNYWTKDEAFGSDAAKGMLLTAAAPKADQAVLDRIIDIKNTLTNESVKAEVSGACFARAQVMAENAAPPQE